MLAKKDNVDRISNLTDCLLHHILSFLNTKQVVQTCVLSKRWKFVWTCIPTLNFDIKSYTFQGSSKNTSLKQRSFRHFIFSFLSQHCGTHIQKLVYTSTINNDETALAQLLVCYGRCHMVQELCIDTFCTDLHDWKWCLSEWQSLTVLKISCVSVDDWGFLVLPSLTTLQISSVWENDEEYEAIIISRCPNLESFVLVNYICESVSISAPKLENLELRYTYEWELHFPEVELVTPNLKCVKFENILPVVKCDLDFSCLEKVNIAVEDCYFTPEYLDTEKLVGHFFKLLRVFHNTTFLTLPLKVLLSVPSTLNGSFLFHNLRHLKLKTEGANKNMLDLPIIPLAYFLKCPNLETLVVDLNQDYL